ncbi:MAG: hypothetical protein ACHQ4G_03760 [Opitutales bacterium]
MKTKLLLLLALGAGLFGTAALAEDSATAPTASPASFPAQTMAADQVIYAPQLPSIAELTRLAVVQGLTIKQIVQSDRAVSITYQLGNGQTKTLSYQLLSNVATAPAPAAAPAATQVVYVAPGPYYYDPFYYPYYGPYWAAPVAVSIGFGFHGGGGYRGGFHGRRW